MNRLTHMIQEPRSAGEQCDGAIAATASRQSRANIPHSGDGSESLSRTPAWIFIWFWFGFCWGAVSCLAFAIAALARGWLEVWL